MQGGKDSCLATPVSSPDRGFDEGETLGPCEIVADSLLDERVLSVQMMLWSILCRFLGLEGPCQAFTPFCRAANF